MMKLKLFFILCFLQTANAVTFSQEQKWDVVFENVSIEAALQQLHRQTGYQFFYLEKNLSATSTVTLDMKQATLEQVLDIVLKKQGFYYEIKNGVVSILSGRQQEDQKKITLSGVVKDQTGNFLPGVTIRLVGTQIGVASDINGKFSLGLAETSGVLEFSFVGFKVIRMPFSELDAGRRMEIRMEEEIKNLGEVMVTGYQTLSRERATGSYDIVSQEQLNKPTPNIASRLVGVIAGVQATLDVNGDPTFQIRGKSSLYADAQPLVVVDGFPIEGDFKSVNPNDVESITILKDAAAASIWGARSANGVIVITTKGAGKLKKGDLQVYVSSFVRFAPKIKLDYARSVASSADAIEFDKLSYGNWGGKLVGDSWDRTSSSYTAGKVALNEHRLGYLTDTELNEVLNRYANQDNSDQIRDHILQVPCTHQHSVNIASASERARHFLSLMYEGRDLHLKGNDGEKIIVNYKMSSNLYKWLDFNFSGTYMYDRSTNNSVGIPQIAPYEMLVEGNGKRLPVSHKLYMPNLNRYVPMEKFPYADWTYNPISETEGRDLTSKQNVARVQTGFNFKFMEGLNLTTNFKYELNNTHVRNYYGEETYEVRYNVNYYAYWNQDDDTFTLNVPKGSMLDQSRVQTDVWNFRAQLNFDRVFGKHALVAVTGTEMTSERLQNFGYTRTYGYDDERLTVGAFPNGFGSYTNPNLKIKNWMGYSATIYEGISNSFSYSSNHFFSLYANASYTYDSRYTLSGSIRTDASNLITDDPKYRYQPMWSLGGSWLVSAEDFMESEKWVDRLLLRVTYGFNGNVDNSTTFKPLITYYSNHNTQTNAPYAKVSSYGNPALRWEKTGVFNLGADYSLWQGKLFGKIDYYRKSGKDLIAMISIPEVNGTKSQKINAANMVNNGIEWEIGTTLPICKNLTWQGQGNVAYNRNEVTKLFVSSYYYESLIPWGNRETAFVKGKNANTIYGLQYAGLKNVGTAENPNMQPQIRDKNGNLHGLAGWPEADVRDLAYEQGTTVAPWVVGFSNTFKYRNWDIAFILTGKFGHVFRRESYNYNGDIPNAKLSEVLQGDPNKIMPLPQNERESRYYFWDRFWPFFSYLTESANHVRLQELSLTYSFPVDRIKRLGIRSLQLYGMANNVCSIYANKFKEDPEFPRGTIKPEAYFTFGVKIGL